MTIEKISAEWNEKKTFAWIDTGDDSLSLRLELAEWYPNGSRERQIAWIVSVFEHGEDGVVLTKREVECPALDAGTEERRQQLVDAAFRAVASEPSPLLVSEVAPAPMSADEWSQLLDVQILAWGDANGRLSEACQSNEDWKDQLVYVALSETLSWVYTIDNSLQWWWRWGLSLDSREELSLKTDARIARLHGAEPNDGKASLTDEQIESEPRREAVADRRRTSEPYANWFDVSHVGWFSEQAREAVKWVRGQLTHTAVASPAHLVQFRDGAEPRWKWADAKAFARSKEGKGGAASYARAFAGKDVLGTFGHYWTDFTDAQRMFASVMRSEVETGAAK